MAVLRPTDLDPMIVTEDRKGTRKCRLSFCSVDSYCNVDWSFCSVDWSFCSVDWSFCSLFCFL